MQFERAYPNALPIAYAIALAKHFEADLRFLPLKTGLGAPKRQPWKGKHPRIAPRLFFTAGPLASEPGRCVRLGVR
jgi:hypothetical protein